LVAHLPRFWWWRGPTFVFAFGFIRGLKRGRMHPFPRFEIMFREPSSKSYWANPDEGKSGKRTIAVKAPGDSFHNSILPDQLRDVSCDQIEEAKQLLVGQLSVKKIGVSDFGKIILK
jgi:hypothetical protein